MAKRKQDEGKLSPPWISALGLHAADLAGLLSRAGCDACSSVLAGCKHTPCVRVDPNLVTSSTDPKLLPSPLARLPLQLRVCL